MRAHLIEIVAADSVGDPATLRFCSVDDRACCHLNGQQWLPAIARLPVLRYDFFDGDFRGEVATPTAGFSISIDLVESFASMRLAGGTVTIYSGQLGDAWGDYVERFAGQIEAEPRIADGLAEITAGPDDAWLDKPLLDTFAGSGGIEGPDDLQGAVKPLIFGACRFVPGVLIDATNLVFFICKPLEDVTAVYDRAASLGASTGDYVDLAALLAADIAPGSWATCLAEGLVRLGALPDGKVSFDVEGENAGSGGFVRKPGAIIGRVAALAGGTTDSANLAALDTARPYNQSLVLNSQVTAREVIREVAAGVAATAGITFTGSLFVQPLAIGSASDELASDGTAPMAVKSVARSPIAAPFWRLAMPSEPTWNVHDIGEVATGYTIRGAYSATRVYRKDDLVYGDDGASWAYINDAPAAGQALPVWPTTSNAHWENVSPPTDGEAMIDASMSPDRFALKVNTDGSVISYDGAVFAFRARLSDGTDISDLFTLALATDGNPAGLTHTFDNVSNPRTVTISGGFTAAEAPATLTLEATGTAAYSDVVLTRTITLDADSSDVVLQQILLANNRNDNEPAAPTSITGVAQITGSPHPDGTVSYKARVNFTYDSDPADPDNFDAIFWLAYASTSSSPYTLLGPEGGGLANGERGGLWNYPLTAGYLEGILLSHVDPTKWYTIGFLKARKVDPDLGTWVWGPILQYGPFRPASLQQPTSALDLSQTGGFMSKLTGTDQVRPIPRGLTSVTIPLSSTADIQIDLKRFKNGVDVTASNTWAIASSHNCSASVGASTGIVTVTGSTLGQVVTGERGNAYVIVTATDATGTVERWKLGFELDLGALVSIDSASARPFVVANPGGISSFSQTFYSYVMSDVLTYRTGSVGGRRIVAVYEYASPLSGQFGIDLMLQEKLSSSGTWLDSFEYTAFDPVDYDANYLRKRYAVIISDATGATANTSYDARIRPKKTTGVVGGSGLIEGKVFAAQGY